MLLRCRKTYRAEITSTGITLATTCPGDSGMVTSMRTTWPACGDCNPSCGPCGQYVRDRAAWPPPAERVVHLRQAVSLRLQRFDLVSIFDCFEMLEGIRHYEQEKAAERDAELPNFARVPRIFYFHQPRVIDGLGKINFRRARPARDVARHLPNETV